MARGIYFNHDGHERGSQRNNYILESSIKAHNIVQNLSCLSIVYFLLLIIDINLFFLFFFFHHVANISYEIIIKLSILNLTDSCFGANIL